ncbi:YkvA family protein [Bacillus sp. AK031]
MAKFLKRLRFLFNIRRSIPFLVAFFKSSSVKGTKKFLSVALIIGYILLPFDIIPDWLVIFGIVDDIAVFTLILQQIIKMAPDELKDKYDVKV